MHDYDNALKTLLRRQASRTLEALAGGTVSRWLNVEQPKPQALRVDLLGETSSGGLLHIELQSTNDRTMPLRMLEYSVGIRRACGQFPHQVLLYVGQPPFGMEAQLNGPGLAYRYHAVDARQLDGKPYWQASRWRIMCLRS